MKDWEYGALDIHNPKLSTLRRYFELVVSEAAFLQGNVLEFGVSTGRSIVTTALLLTELGSTNKVLGFDSFGGFPRLTAEDNPDQFKNLLELGDIDFHHWQAVQRNFELVRARTGNSNLSAKSISNSTNFSATSEELVLRKLAVFGLQEKVQLVRGDFSTDPASLIPRAPIAAALLDSDLFSSYVAVLDFVWPLLIEGAFIYLDEYYSLKFPGPRIAVNDFVRRTKDAKLIQLEPWMDFERWILRKVC